MFGVNERSNRQNGTFPGFFVPFAPGYYPWAQGYVRNGDLDNNRKVADARAKLRQRHGNDTRDTAPVSGLRFC
ncbi:hypothetical protein NKJ06_32085 [Mesorhizobium sp. M0293]|uniref:hypothetical protein n=1 Tax=unclassified Mesorhizobium TaxID=325217 RepID=UPI003339F848